MEAEPPIWANNGVISLQQCGDSEILRWNSTSDNWECATLYGKGLSVENRPSWEHAHPIVIQFIHPGEILGADTPVASPAIWMLVTVVICVVIAAFLGRRL